MLKFSDHDNASRLKNWVLFIRTDGITWQILMTNAKSSDQDENQKKRRKKDVKQSVLFAALILICLRGICLNIENLNAGYEIQTSKIISGTTSTVNVTTDTQSP